VERGKRRNSMSAEENKENARRPYEEAFGQRRPEVIVELVNPDFVCWDPKAEAERSGGWRP
jgi:hypothetical protein